jgi:hypothetical protein
MVDKRVGNHGMTQRQFECTAKVVWAVVTPWLRLQFGEKCDDYEFGCECCERWRHAEQLLAFERGTASQGNLQKEIEELEECLRWRKELLQKMTATETKQEQ